MLTIILLILTVPTKLVGPARNPDGNHFLGYLILVVNHNYVIFTFEYFQLDDSEPYHVTIIMAPSSSADYDNISGCLLRLY